MTDGRVVWLTGLSGAGKTTVATRLAELLTAEGTRPVLLDGDRIRAALPAPTGYSAAERRALAASYGRFALDFAHQGHLVLCATISLFHDVQQWNRSHLPGYLEVLLRVPEEELAARNSKGLYSPAGRAVQVTGVDLAAEFPTAPDLVIDNSAGTTVDSAAERILHALQRRELP
ncbi:adenylyl-sulfate kinase [Kitasatospora sp. NPDC058063]|uniref:adenylyl-sulfate kinase n=1 Tax=unclassified Kitasatospora TaxID=2633591 RepID=UPI0036D86931